MARHILIFLEVAYEHLEITVSKYRPLEAGGTLIPTGIPFNLYNSGRKSEYVVRGIRRPTD